MYDLIIFDCDGVLVDSELLSANVLMAMLRDVGLPITMDDFGSDFLGRSFATAAARTEARFGRKLPDGFQLQYRERLLAQMDKELRPMPGIEVVLNDLTVPYCLATSSSPLRLARSLSVTGLETFFIGRAFTASEVKNGKPAPDLHLHSAARMGADPRKCLVIEDSEMGILAARNAGMTVWQFSGGSHVRAGYRVPEHARADRAFEDMAALSAGFKFQGLCRSRDLP